MPPWAWELLKIAGVLVMVIAMIAVLSWRRRSLRAHLDEMAEQEVCEHLKPALEALKGRGHRIIDVGQRAAEYPLEIHIAPRFDPAGIAKELNLEPPVYVSERNVLYCKDDWCELHPRG